MGANSERFLVEFIESSLVQWRDSAAGISAARRREQFKCMFGISLGIVRELIEGRSMNEEVYRKLW
ncbi:MAG: hypothetical protein U9P14_06790 [Gemmatimonadota bacterium]|nr:hypothetical protein [Gemmatimonadota bacterium]